MLVYRAYLMTMNTIVTTIAVWILFTFPIHAQTPAPTVDIYSESVAATELESPDVNYQEEDLSCGCLHYYSPENNDSAIAFFKFNVASTTPRPVLFSTCYNYYSSGVNTTDTWMRLFYKKSATTYDLIEYEDDVVDGNQYRTCAEINRTELPDGEYVLVVGQWWGSAAFPVQVECGGTSGYTPGEGELVGVIIAVTFVALCCVTCFMIFYCKQMRKFKAAHRSLEKKKSPHHEQNSIKFQEVVEHDIEDNYDKDQAEILTETTVKNVYETESDEAGDKDKIREIVGSIIQSCENESDLDIYQVLAFRRLDAKSWKLRLFKPFEPLGINYELLNISAYHKAIFVAAVVSILQCVGITVILFSATHSYFNEENKKNQACHWTLPDWNNSWHFKLLAFLWCVVITLKVSIDIKKFKANGFTQIIDRVSHNEYHKFYKIVNLNIVQIGYLVNLYTLLVAVFGSYWIVYASEQGSESVEMVLNAVALFFMIELDDILVTDKDYLDMKIRMQQYLERYDIITGDVDNMNDPNSGYEDKVDDEKHLNRLIRVSVATKYCSYFITALTIIGGAIAPWIILLCYG